LISGRSLATGRPGSGKPLGPDSARPDERLLAPLERLGVGDRLALAARPGVRRHSERELGTAPSSPPARAAGAASQATERGADLQQLGPQPLVLLHELAVLALKRFVPSHQLGDLVDDATAVTGRA